MSIYQMSVRKLACIMLFWGVYAHAQEVRPPLGAVSPQTLQRFVQVFDTVRREYVEPISDELLFSAAISGMLKEIDPHAEYLDAKGYQNLRAWSEGQMATIAATIEKKGDAFFIKDSADPLLLAGDKLQKINGVSLDDKSEADVLVLLRGVAGGRVALQMRRAGKVQNISVLRQNAVRAPVEIRTIDGVGVVRLSAFNQSTRTDILNGLARLREPIGALVLDMRDNPGGVLDAALEVAGLFVDTQTLAYIEKTDGARTALVAKGMPNLAKIPLVIVQNRQSASAAEILAVGLKSLGRATVVGETSFGKGSVQSVIPVDDGAVKLTTAHYVSITGDTIDGVGVTADMAGNVNTAVALAKKRALAKPITFGHSNDF